MNIFTKLVSLLKSETEMVPNPTDNSARVKYGGLHVSKELDKFLRDEVVTGINIQPSLFWKSLESILDTFGPKNIELLAKRESLQKQIDNWHIERKGQEHNAHEYKNFLKEIGYLLEEGDDFSIETSDVDPEIKTVAGPQLVVPVSNARFALNAANARWGSLYDALYGTDLISEDDGSERSGGYNPVRGNKVIAFAKNFLNETVPLKEGYYEDATSFMILGESLQVELSDGTRSELKNTNQYIGFAGDPNNPRGILLKNNNLHLEIQIDKDHNIGMEDLAGIKDVLLESAITTIQDCEDSVAAVDASDKVLVYRNWLGLMKGDLQETFTKGNSEMTRSLNPDRSYTLKDGKELSLPGRSLMLVRNVGHLMTNPAVLDKDGNEIPEGILDAMFTICIAKHDLEKSNAISNSRKGSIYIVKPKMHGPKEVKFTCDLFAAVEKELSMKPLCVKVGIMDEERRTTVNLKECIRIAKDRVIFINTGFLDRTGDEIHTSMEAGPMVPKDQMKQQPWIAAYEDWNVDTGLQTGFKGKAQIGKGMWAMPDEMLEMFKAKIMHPKAGANCAWVPSPTAASLHVMHYHKILVGDEQESLKSRTRASLDDILSIPIMEDPTTLTPSEIQNELDNNAQGILGYVVRWVDSGVGCSKVPDINNIGLMEDRATCRISSQHIANWLHHAICSEEQVIETMKKMAIIVDEQNSHDDTYQNMAPDYNGYAFIAALELAIKGRIQPSGYTEPILHAKRLEYKK
ncbi:MAG: malate synthase G [SAR86 cluster bacterium]|uniref:Malate synthase G n=1 Tax=SAR86 cluster bacterium TaxID=2030880 RepID=A0A368C3Y5_9GAMM|nr:MAG: malate synthase G [SAR86 cluster bacterium]RPG39064.1 MAG: malate synthase G [Gammaproteobacteria bacterium TMED186]|tara:strand:- start:1271 stop:3505 length:2235 start_codon:yes stop_codon:yes gene_type:complete